MNREVKDGQKGGSRALARAAGLVSLLTLLSRLLGLAREQAFAALLGAGLHADAFQIAFRIPNLLRDLFAEGALSAAFVPTYTRTLAEDGREAAHRLGSRLLTVLAAILGMAILVGAVFALPLVEVLAPGFDDVPGKTAITILLTRIMLPFLPLISFAAVTMGMLNAQEKYVAPALAPSMFNLVAVVWAVLLWALGLPPEQAVMGWAAGTLLGGAAQFLIQVPPLRSEGWRFRPEWTPGDPRLRQIASLMAPATIGLAAVQLNIFISARFASHEPGAVSWLTYAFRILYLPIGIFGVAVGTIATTGLARRAAMGDVEGLRETLRQALRMVAFLSIPATAGLLTVGAPVVRLLYERGRFGPHDTEATAAALTCYALGLLAYTAVKVLAPAFYALGTPRVPLLASASAVATNILVIVSLHQRLGFRGVALGTAAGSFVNVIILAGVFERRWGGLCGHGLGRAILTMVAAALVMVPAAHYAAVSLEGAVGTRGLSAQLLTGLAPVVAGVLAYGALARLLRIPEADALMSALRRRRE